MPGNPHGTFEIGRHGELIVVRFRGSFNLEGARRVTRGIQMFWHGCGEPARWPVLADLREWEGATPEAFPEAASILQWMVGHGMVAEARVFTGQFMPRVLDQQPHMKVSAIRSENFQSIEEACAWLEAQGFRCGEYLAQSHARAAD